MTERRRFTGEEEAELRRLHALGRSWAEIARKLERTKTGVWQVGRRLGLASHRYKPTGRALAGAPRDPVRVKRAVEMRRAGRSLGQIAAELGCRRQAVYSMLARWGNINDF
jgi:DNA invertase Pin-like site-specific DNA recombinase